MMTRTEMTSVYKTRVKCRSGYDIVTSEAFLDKDVEMQVSRQNQND